MRVRSVLRVAGPTAVVITVWLIAGWLPARAQGAEDERREEADAERIHLQSELQAVRDLPAASDGLDRRIQAGEAAVPSEMQLDDFLEDAGVAAALSGVVVDQIAPIAIASDLDPASMGDLPRGTASTSISLGATGSYERLVGFVDRLRDLDRLVVIDLIGFNADEEDPSVVTLDLELRIFTTDRSIAPADLDSEGLEGEEGIEVTDEA